MMKSKMLIMGGLTAALVIAVGGFVLTQLPVGGATTASGPSSSSSTPTQKASPPPSAATADPGTGAPPTDAAIPPADGKRFTTEVQPPGEATQGLPASKVLPELVSAPLPESASAVGALAKGYPAKALPAAPGSKIRNSSVASDKTHLQVTLTAKTDAEVTEVVAFYRTALANYGMYDTPSPALNGATAVSFSRGANSVTVTATPGSGGTTYVVFGTFTVKG
ncbi:hypothetical protein [Leifsonia sp. NPDC058230]|uniref:hypothetical protein n=1 Tax=Leifsonia sp. NPDC058230 TaxID=3346391 RepID=UPI0036DB156F